MAFRETGLLLIRLMDRLIDWWCLCEVTGHFSFLYYTFVYFLDFLHWNVLLLSSVKEAVFRTGGACWTQKKSCGVVATIHPPGPLRLLQNYRSTSHRCQQAKCANPLTMKAHLQEFTLPSYLHKCRRVRVRGCPHRGVCNGKIKTTVTSVNKGITRITIQPHNGYDVAIKTVTTTFVYWHA